MAHEIETAMFVATPAWHKLGIVLPNAPSIDEAIVAAGLDWQVEEMALKTADGRDVTSHRAMMRSTDKSLLGVVGNDFTPLQNNEAFDQFREIVDSGEVTIEAAGSLRGGKRIWILAALKDGVAEVAKGDAIKSHVLLAHAHDGSLAIRMGFTKTRVVCANTLAVALRSDKGNLVTVRHTKGAKAKLEKAREVFDMQRAELRASIDTYRELAKRGCDDRNAIRYIREVMKPGAGDDTKVKVQNVDDMLRMFEYGRGAELSRGTMWGAFNAVTEYMTHERGRGDDSRQNSNWFGGGAKLADRALDLAVQFAKDAPLAEQSRAAYANFASAKAEMDVLMSRPRTAPAVASTSGSSDFAALLGKPRRTDNDAA